MVQRQTTAVKLVAVAVACMVAVAINWAILSLLGQNTRTGLNMALRECCCSWGWL